MLMRLAQLRVGRGDGLPSHIEYKVKIECLLHSEILAITLAEYK